MINFHNFMTQYIIMTVELNSNSDVMAGHYNPGSDGRSQISEPRIRKQKLIFTIFIHLFLHFLHVKI